MKNNLENNQNIINFFSKKKFYSKFKNIVLTTSDGYDLPFLHYTQLGLGNLILTYLYALYIKSKISSLEIIPFYPIRIIPIIKDFKYWYLSYNNTSYPTKSGMLEIIKQYSNNVEIKERKHNYQITGKKKKQVNNEYLFIVKNF